MPKDELNTLIKNEISNMIGEQMQGIKSDIACVQKSVARIERLLVGDDQLKDKGYAEMITASFEYINKSNNAKIIERGSRAISFFETWENEGHWKQIKEIIQSYTFIRTAYFIIIGSGLLSVANIITIILELIKNFNS